MKRIDQDDFSMAGKGADGQHRQIFHNLWTSWLSIANYTLLALFGNLPASDMWYVCKETGLAIITTETKSEQQAENVMLLSSCNTSNKSDPVEIRCGNTWP